MENRIYDENNGLWYVKKGDYYLPELALPPEEEKPIGIWGWASASGTQAANWPSRQARKRHLQYLKEHKQLVYINLLTCGGLNEYLASVDEQAEDLFSRLVKEYADKQEVTEQLKAENQLLWVQKMNNIRMCVREVVEREIFYL